MIEGIMLAAAFLLITIIGPRVLVRLVKRLQKHEKERDPFEEEA